MRHWSVAGFCLLWATVGLAADAPYFGKWKVNSSKSEFNDIATIEKLPSGEYRFEDQGFVYKFKPDGKEYPMPDGGTTSWKIVDDNTWGVTNRTNGKVTSIINLSANGDTLTSETAIPQEGGKDLKQTGTFKRLSKGTGVPGKWQAVKANADEFWIEVMPDGADGLKLTAANSICVAKFDGKPYPMTGPGDPPKQSMSFRKKGPSSFEAVTYLDGKPFSTDIFTVTGGGKELTDVSTPAATKKPAKTVFERE